jgi:hypothetical protein
MFWSTPEYRAHFDKTTAKKMHMGHQGRTPSNVSAVDHVYPNNLYDELRKKSGKYSNPTTGLMALDYITNCNPKTITVYGFDWKVTPTFTDPDRRKDPKCPHDYDTEREYCKQVFFSKPNITLRS